MDELRVEVLTIASCVLRVENAAASVVTYAIAAGSSSGRTCERHQPELVTAMLALDERI